MSDADRALIRAAATKHRDAGAELEALTFASGLSLARTWQRLNELLGDQDAWEAEPVAMHYLARRRDRHTRVRGRGPTSGG